MLLLWKLYNIKSGSVHCAGHHIVLVTRQRPVTIKWCRKHQLWVIWPVELIPCLCRLRQQVLESNLVLPCKQTSAKGRRIRGASIALKFSSLWICKPLWERWWFTSSHCSYSELICVITEIAYISDHLFNRFGFVHSSRFACMVGS